MSCLPSGLRSWGLGLRVTFPSQATGIGHGPSGDCGPRVPGPLLVSLAPQLWASGLHLARWSGGCPGLPPGLTQNPPPRPQPGDMKSDSLNNCTFFSCVKIHDQLISSVSNITCPDFDPSTCVQVSGPVPAGVGTLMCLRGWAPSQDVATAAGSALGPSTGTALSTLMVGGITVTTGGGLGSQLSLLPARAPSRSCPTAAAGNVSVGLRRVGPAAQAWQGLPPDPLRGGRGRGWCPGNPVPSGPLPAGC